MARAREFFVDTRGLRSFIVRGGDIRSLTLNISEQGASIQVDAGTAEDVSFMVEAPKARFAPQGAKEVSFRVRGLTPENASVAGDVVGALAACIASRLWPYVRDASDADIGPIVEREGDDRLRSDLRSVPSVRHAMGRHRAIMEVLTVRGMRFAEHGLFIQVGLSGLG